MDLKSLVGNVTMLLHNPIKDWIDEKPKVVSVTLDATVGQVIKALHQNKAHRVYVCEDEKPYGIDL
jgi:CBS domain-containing protein